MATINVPGIPLAQAAIQAQAGDVVLIQPGIYDGLIRVHGTGEPHRPITFRGQGAVMTGGFIPDTWPGDDVIGGAHGNPYCVFEGFVFVGRQHRFQLRLSTGSKAVSCMFEGGQNGINARGDRVSILNNEFRSLDGHAYVIYGSTGSLVQVNDLWRINARQTSNPSASAVSKCGYTTGLDISHNRVTDCRGPGIWLDFENRDYTIAHNSIRRNVGGGHISEGPGIQTEINEGPGVIEQNIIQGCSGPGIAILESAHVTVRENTITGGYAGIELRNLARGPRIHDVLIEHNTIRALVPTAPVRIAAIKCAVGDPPAAGAVITTGNTFDVGTHALYDWFGVKAFTIAEAQAMGFEQ